jgi:hypothetical protein
MSVEKIPGWIERLLLPKLSEISSDVKNLDVKLMSFRNETKTEINSIRSEIVSVRNEISGLRTEILQHLKSYPVDPVYVILIFSMQTLILLF